MRSIDELSGDLEPSLQIRGVAQPYFVDIAKNVIEIVKGRTFSENEIINLSAVDILKRPQK